MYEAKGRKFEKLKIYLTNVKLLAVLKHTIKYALLFNYVRIVSDYDAKLSMRRIPSHIIYTVAHHIIAGKRLTFGCGGGRVKEDHENWAFSD